MFASLDLQEFEQTFSAYQKESDEDQKNHSSFTKPKTPVLTVIDGRRAQNCTILLSKLKLTNAELAQAIMNVDPREDLPKDMVEQVKMGMKTVIKMIIVVHTSIAPLL